jgi:hypothetical protein
MAVENKQLLRKGQLVLGSNDPILAAFNSVNRKQVGEFMGKIAKRTGRVFVAALVLACFIMASCRQGRDEMRFGKSKLNEIYKGPFGSCCKDLADCMKQPNALIRTNEDGTLFLTIGYVQTEQGPGWFDHAVIFCPFCGTKLQDRQALAAKVEKK